MEGLARMEIDAPPKPTGNLLVAHREGDPEAFRTLVAQYRRPVYGYLVRTGVPEEDRDDLFQDVFIKIHERAVRYDPQRPLHPWLFTVVANTVRTYFRTKRLRQVFVWGENEHVADPAPDHEKAVSAKETTAWLQRAIAALPEKQRQALVLSAIESVPLKDIATALEIPLNTVKTHIRRARLRLVESYERRTRGQHD